MKLLLMKIYTIRIYKNNIKNRIVLKIKTGYKLELLANETMKLLSDGTIIDQNKYSTNLHNLRLLQPF